MPRNQSEKKKSFIVTMERLVTQQVTIEIFSDTSTEAMAEASDRVSSGLEGELEWVTVEVHDDSDIWTDDVGSAWTEVG